jgi:hypothetical protein
VLEPTENLKTTKESLQELLTTFFDNKITEFGNNYEKYRPKIYLELGKEGLEVIIHIACKFGDFAKTQNEIIENIINKFAKQKIGIKFKK